MPVFCSHAIVHTKNAFHTGTRGKTEVAKSGIKGSVRELVNLQSLKGLLSLEKTLVEAAGHVTGRRAGQT